MSDYSKMISVLAKSHMDYYCFSDEDSHGNISNYIVTVKDGIMTTFEFITYLEYPEDKSQTFVGMTTENVEFNSLGEYVAYRYDMEIVKEEVQNSDFCDIEDYTIFMEVI